MNRLANENSPYLLQHKNNPVDWYAWSEEALAAAKQSEKPIFLSIGYAACHWCHVMEHESFEDEAVAELLNLHFVSIKVDREERPELDDIYMSAVVAMTGQGGWPLSLFLTPEGVPFYGGTYFPPARRYGMPAFKEILQAVSHAWATDRQNIVASADKIRSTIESDLARKDLVGGDIPTPTDIASAVNRLEQSYDWSQGGWGKAPKFPQPMAINFLLLRGTLGDEAASRMALHALDHMAAGGMYDVVGGGFSRYSVDDKWLVPHFEKMLYDNAQLAVAYLRGYLSSGNETFKRIATESLDFILREMRGADGGFVSSLDADSEGEEGKYYVWDKSELEELCDPLEFDIVRQAFGLDEGPNFESNWILRPKHTRRELAETSAIENGETNNILDRFLKSAFEARQMRVRPATDDKILLSWNALTITALTEAGRYLGNQTYLNSARSCAEFVLGKMRAGDGLMRSYRSGTAKFPAYLEDYASFALSLLGLYQADQDVRWFREASRLLNYILENFSSKDNLFNDVSNQHESLIITPRNIQDNATPAGNSQLALLLLRMATLTGNQGWLETAEKMLHAVSPMAVRYPTAFANWLYAIDYYLNEKTEIAIVFDGSAVSSLDTIRDPINSTWHPLAEFAVSAFPPPPEAPELLHGRPLNGHPLAIYLCHGFTCRAPLFDIDQLDQALAEHQR